ncbi:hypothetical protein HRI_000528200 [Hibiscus trionum]|uniref:Uncharacterized protein n=1 Tax=Hibiscus trionum TaxID=183268 RepID=A0A9W7GZY6_HIBTR|nr:hypothetical protein HRI_000528200 [Hibiscus trionum]
MSPLCVGCLSQRNTKRFKSQLKNVKKHKKGGIKNMQAKREKLRAEMEEQVNIREEERGVREKFEGVANECEELKRETRTIIQQTATTQIKLALMLHIVKASKQPDHATLAALTHMLREIVKRENEERQASVSDES